MAAICPEYSIVATLATVILDVTARFHSAMNSGPRSRLAEAHPTASIQLGGGLQLGQSSYQRGVEELRILTVMGSTVAVRAQSDDLPGVIRSVVPQTLCVVGLKKRCPVGTAERSVSQAAL